MRSILFIFCFCVGFTGYTQNVGIGTATPESKLQINHRSSPGAPGLLLLDSNLSQSGLIRFRNFNSPKFIEAWGYSGNSFSTAEQYLDIQSDTAFIATFRGNGNVGINKLTPIERLDVNGNINLTGTIKANGVQGQSNQILSTNASGNLAWTSMGNSNNVGFGSWGDCSVNNISEYNPVADATGAADDFFGWSVSISGNYAIVGAFFDDVGANENQGSASIYQFNGINWVLMQKITNVTGAAGDQYGSSVSISGNYAIVGAMFDNVAANSDQGSASIYQFNGSNWVLMQNITDAGGTANDFFGWSVSISGSHAIVGASSDDVGPNTGQGSASIYLRVGNIWQKLQYTTDPSGAASDYLGVSVSVDGTTKRFLVGAAWVAESIGKAIFGKIN